MNDDPHPCVRPTCLWCNEPLRRHVRSVAVPVDVADPLLFVLEQHPLAVFLDRPEKIARQQADQVAAFQAHGERVREARVALEHGSNEFPAAGGTILDQNRRRTVEDAARFDPLPTDYPVSVRFWIPGEFGPDGRTLFHSGGCARRWAIHTAADLRRRGLL